MTAYEKIDSLYNYVWGELNRLDCEISCAHDAATRGYFTGMHMAYLNMLGQISPESVSKRIEDFGEREKLRQ